MTGQAQLFGNPSRGGSKAQTGSTQLDTGYSHGFWEAWEEAEAVTGWQRDFGLYPLVIILTL